MSKSAGFPAVSFATSNFHKFTEIKTIFDQKTSIYLEHLKISLLEIQSASLEEVAAFSLNECARMTENSKFFVEDTGLFIESLLGFPGVYSAYILETIGLNGIMTLMKNSSSRKAAFQSVIALKLGNITKFFTGQIKGHISKRISDIGWGYDPIFIPDCDGKRTFGELGEEKNIISHRFIATQKLIEFLNRNLNKVK
ncbi:MAG: non-canonical purine NTP pyrophosphatase [Candidatus Hodarchaeales archaeon]|jgi:XTP/dITP diphosphohydrolase